MLKILSITLLILLGCGPDKPKEEAIFMPKNDLGATEGRSAVTEDEFNRVIDLAEEIYTPIIASLGGNLFIDRLWDDPTINASALQFDGNWVVNMYGGLARRSEITVDGFAAVLCHEIGHHLAGYPFVEDWAANEGQSDYYALQTCLRKMFEGSDNRGQTPHEPKLLCNKKYGDEYNRNLCYRGIIAAKSIADLLGALNAQTVWYTTNDTDQVSATDDSHPDAQCRLDTMIAGALCSKTWDDSLIPGKIGDGLNETAAVTCVRGVSAVRGAVQEMEAGYRPRCWYAP